MKYKSITLKATAFEAFLTGGKITLLQGNTYENAILRHINEREEFEPDRFEKELFPFLPSLIGEKLLRSYVQDGKLLEWNGKFQTPDNWKPGDNLPEIPENSIVKVKFLEMGDQIFPVEASLDNYRWSGKNSAETMINGFYSTSLNGRPSYSVNFESCLYFDRKNFNSDPVRFEFEKRVAVLYVGKKEVARFTGIELSELLPKEANLEEGTLGCEVESPFDTTFLQPFEIGILHIEGVDFTMQHPIRLTRVPNRPASAVNALYLLVAKKGPQDADSYRLVVNQIWKTIGAPWGFEKEEVFPGGFPSYDSFVRNGRSKGYE